MKADFEAFTRESGKVQGDINHYNIQASDSLTDRAKEVMTNVRDFVMSYNFDESDPMTDYFHTNFYLTLGIGSYRQPYRMELPKITGKDTLKCSGIPKDLHTRLCARHWARPGSASSRVGDISGNDTRRGLLRLTGRTLFLAQGIFECEDGTETHRETGGSRNALRTDRLQRRIHTPARIYPGNGKQSGTERQEYATAYRTWQSRRNFKTT